MGELVLGNVLAKHHAVVGVVVSGFVSSLHEANSASCSLQTAIFETCHLVIETLTKATFEANEIFCWYEPVVERNFIRVHTAIADGVDGAAFHLSAFILREHETVRIAVRLWHDEQTESLVAKAAVGASACEQHEHVGAGAKGAPCFHAINAPALAAIWCFAWCSSCFDACYVATEVGFSYCNSSEHFCAGKFWQPFHLLLFGAALHECASENFGAGNERATNAE